MSEVLLALRIPSCFTVFSDVVERLSTYSTISKLWTLCKPGLYGGRLIVRIEVGPIGKYLVKGRGVREQEVGFETRGQE